MGLGDHCHSDDDHGHYHADHEDNDHNYEDDYNDREDDHNHEDDHDEDHDHYPVLLFRTMHNNYTTIRISLIEIIFVSTSSLFML